jgi:hypothetical protein
MKMSLVQKLKSKYTEKSQIKTINKVCDTEKAEITAEKVRWKWAFWGLFIVVSIFIAKKVIK